MAGIKDLIVDVPDWPKPGITFKDITPLLANNAWFETALIEMVEEVALERIDLIVGIESRGFIMGSALAAVYDKGFIPMRKKGKLPPPVISEEYDLEYGKDILEIKLNNGEPKTVLLVDDVLATGGTLKAAVNLCTKANYIVHDVSVLIDLKFLNDFTWVSSVNYNLHNKVKSVLEYV